MTIGIYNMTIILKSSLSPNGCRVPKVWTRSLSSFLGDTSTFSMLWNCREETLWEHVSENKMFILASYGNKSYVCLFSVSSIWMSCASTFCHKHSVKCKSNVFRCMWPHLLTQYVFPDPGCQNSSCFWCCCTEHNCHKGSFHLSGE